MRSESKTVSSGASWPFAGDLRDLFGRSNVPDAFRASPCALSCFAPAGRAPCVIVSRNSRHTIFFITLFLCCFQTSISANLTSFQQPYRTKKIKRNSTHEQIENLGAWSVSIRFPNSNSCSRKGQDGFKLAKPLDITASTLWELFFPQSSPGDFRTVTSPPRRRTLTSSVAALSRPRFTVCTK